MKIKALLFAVVAMVGISAAADVPATTKLYVNDVTVENPGDKAYPQICLANPDQPELSTFQVEFIYPEGFTAVKISPKEVFGSGSAVKNWQVIVPEGRADEYYNEETEEGHSAFSVGGSDTPPSGNSFMATCIDGDASGKAFGAGDDALTAFGIQTPAASTMKAGTFEIQMVNAVVSGTNNDQSLYGAVPASTFKVIINGISTAVNDVTSKIIAGTKYYNLAGVESDQPFDGVNVVVVTYTDGSKVSKKVVR